MLTSNFWWVDNFLLEGLLSINCKVNAYWISCFNWVNECLDKLYITTGPAAEFGQSSLNTCKYIQTSIVVCYIFRSLYDVIFIDRWISH